MMIKVRCEKPPKGFTLIELIITIVVISIALAAMLGAFSSSMARSADPMWRNKTIKLAQLYMDEILSKRYDESTPIGGVPAATAVSCQPFSADTGELNNRALYDDVDDYDGLSERPVGVNGALDASYDNYQVAVTVTCDNAAGAVNSNGANIHAKRIEVAVTPPGKSAMQFFVYKGNF